MKDRESVCVYTQPLNIHNNHKQKTDLLSHFAVVELADKVNVDVLVLDKL